MPNMKITLAFLAAVLLAPLAASAQEEKNTNPAKPEVALANQATRIAWENAPEEKKKSWQEQRAALSYADLSGDTNRQIVIVRGSPEPEGYHAHPTTAMLADNHDPIQESPTGSTPCLNQERRPRVTRRKCWRSGVRGREDF